MKKITKTILPLVLVATLCGCQGKPAATTTKDTTEEEVPVISVRDTLTNVSYLTNDFTLEFNIEGEDKTEYEVTHEGQMQYWKTLNTLGVEVTKSTKNEDEVSTEADFFQTDASGTTIYSAYNMSSESVWNQDYTPELLITSDYMDALTLPDLPKSLSQTSERAFSGEVSGKELLALTDAYTNMGITGNILARESVEQMESVPVFYQLDNEGRPQMIEMDFTNEVDKLTSVNTVKRLVLTYRFNYGEEEKIPDFTKPYEQSGVLVFERE